MDVQCSSMFIYVFLIFLGGECVPNVGTILPKRECYCPLGRFGRKCEKVSSITSKVSLHGVKSRRRHRHKIIKTNVKTLVSPLLIRPKGSQGCQKMRQDPLNMPVEVWRAKIAPKLKNIRKCLRKQGFFDIFFSILRIFEVCAF